MARRLAPLVPPLLLSPGLVACAATLDAGEVATNAEDALEAEVGSRPDDLVPGGRRGRGRARRPAACSPP